MAAQQTTAACRKGACGCPANGPTSTGLSSFITTTAEAAALVAAAWEEGPDWGTLVWLVMVTGLRRAELLALRWSDIDLVGGKVYIRRNHVRVTGRSIEKDTKTHRGRYRPLVDTGQGGVMGSVGLLILFAIAGEIDTRREAVKHTRLTVPWRR